MAGVITLRRYFLLEFIPIVSVKSLKPASEVGAFLMVINNLDTSWTHLGHISDNFVEDNFVNWLILLIIRLFFLDNI